MQVTTWAPSSHPASHPVHPVRLKRPLGPGLDEAHPRHPRVQRLTVATSELDTVGGARSRGSGQGASEAGVHVEDAVDDIPACAVHPCRQAARRRQLGWLRQRAQIWT
jgi:hypothetical protein